MRSIADIQDEIDIIHNKIRDDYTPEVVEELQFLLDELHAERDAAFKAWMDHQLAKRRPSGE